MNGMNAVVLVPYGCISDARSAQVALFLSPDVCQSRERGTWLTELGEVCVRGQQHFLHDRKKVCREIEVYFICVCVCVYLSMREG